MDPIKASAALCEAVKMECHAYVRRPSAMADSLNPGRIATGRVPRRVPRLVHLHRLRVHPVLLKKRRAWLARGSMDFQEVKYPQIACAHISRLYISIGV